MQLIFENLVAILHSDRVLFAFALQELRLSIE